MDKTLFEIINGFGTKVKRRILGVVLMIPIFIILLSTGYFYYHIQENKINHSNTIEGLKNAQADILSATILETYRRSQLQADLTKKNIVEELMIAYNGNLQEMKNDYSERNLDSNFYQILSNNINDKYINKQNDSNRMFIANRTGILIDNSLSHHKDSFISWNEYFSDAGVNGKLLERAIRDITLQNNKAILWIEGDINYTGSIEILDTNEIMSIDDFVHIMCQNNNMEELQKYSFLSVSYIFDHEDMFGVPDVQAGKFMDNDKLFIIQVCSIKDIIIGNHKLHTKLEEYSKAIELKEEVSKTVVAYDTMLMILLIFLELTTFIGTWYLVEFYINNRTLILYQEKQPKIK